MSTPRPAAPGRAARTLRIVLAGLLVAATAYLALAWIAAERFTRPHREVGPASPADAGAAYEEVRLRSADDRADLAAWLLPVEGSDLGVVLVHGRGSSRGRELGGGFVELAARLQEQGYQVLMLDLRGHGASGDGRLGFGMLERFDVVAGVHHLIEARGVRPGGVAVVGVSLGGATGILAAALDPRIGAVWSDSSYAEIGSVVEAEWPSATGLPRFVLPGVRGMHRLRFGFDLLGVRPAAALPALEGRPLTIVHGRADALVPVAHAEALAAAAPWADRWIVAEAPHAGAYGLDPALYGLRLVEFLDASFRTVLARNP